MVRTCSICRHQNRAKIEKDHVEGHLSERAISLKWRVDRKQLGVHLKEHLPQALTKAKDAKEITRADTITQQIEDLKKEFKGLMKLSKKDGDRDSFIKAGRELFRILELMAKVAGELNGNKIQTNVQVNVAQAVKIESPEDLVRRLHMVVREQVEHDQG